MSEPDFTNREITAMFEHIREQLKRIEEQTTKTNGRVTTLEVKQEGVIAKVGTIATLGAAAIVAVLNRVI